MTAEMEAVAQGRLEIARVLGAKSGEAPPEVRTLRPLLATLPVFMSREAVRDVLGIEITAKTMSNHDAAGKGPRARQRDDTGNRSYYLTAYLLEWLEKRGLAPAGRVK